MTPQWELVSLPRWEMTTYWILSFSSHLYSFYQLHRFSKGELPSAQNKMWFSSLQRKDLRNHKSQQWFNCTIFNYQNKTDSNPKPNIYLKEKAKQNCNRTRWILHKHYTTTTLQICQLDINKTYGLILNEYTFWIIYLDEIKQNKCKKKNCCILRHFIYFITCQFEKGCCCVCVCVGGEKCSFLSC